MKRVWHGSARVLGGFLLAAMYAMPQAYTISARPGVINYIEGNVLLNGSLLSEHALKATFLEANETVSTNAGKAEILLTPGVFLRIGDNSEVRMISPSLTNTQVEVIRGEAMIEAAGLVKENNVQIIDHGGSVTIEKDGLYRVSGDAPPTAAVIDGKAEVDFGNQKMELTKGHQTVISSVLKAEKFDPKKEDELYAWSNVRSEYDAAASYQTAKNVAANSYSYDQGWGYGYGGWFSPGWYFDNGFNSWAWLPGAGAFYSPFGWGFYSPGAVGYAPVVTTSIYRGGHWVPGSGTTPGHWVNGHNGDHGHWDGHGAIASVPVNPRTPPAAGVVSASPWANHAARAAAAQSFAESGFRTSSGAPALGFSGSHASYVAGGTGRGWSGGAARSESSARSGGGWSGGHAGGGGSSGGGSSGGGGGHAGGSGGGGGGHR